MKKGNGPANFSWWGETRGYKTSPIRPSERKEGSTKAPMLKGEKDKSLVVKDRKDESRPVKNRKNAVLRGGKDRGLRDGQGG